ncbi:MAG TPA: hypothetical protein VEQ66_02825 [Propionibacteriaceae bacterium]|nr:hypothetical protein [Propionibacteriaceae bacterium]
MSPTSERRAVWAASCPDGPAAHPVDAAQQTDTLGGATSSAFPRLAEDVDDDSDIVDRFVSDFLGLLDVRMDTLRGLLRKSDAAEDIRVAVLSLETTSAMLGATDVVVAARALRSGVAQQEAGTEECYDQLLEAVESLRKELFGQGFRSPPQLPPAAG